MTMNAQRNGSRVRVDIIHGPVEVHVEEEVAHVRHFWGQLGRVLDEAESEEAG